MFLYLYLSNSCKYLYNNMNFRYLMTIHFQIFHLLIASGHFKFINMSATFAKEMGMYQKYPHQNLYSFRQS